MKKKVFNAAEVMEFGRILDARFTAKYSVQDLFNYANKLGIIQTSFGKIDAKKLSISDIINDFLHVEVLQKPIRCLESHTRLFRGALDSIMEAYSKGEYSDEDLRKEYCPDVTEVYTDWMRYKFRCSNEYEAYMLMVGDVEGNNVCNAIDAA